MDELLPKLLLATAPWQKEDPHRRALIGFVTIEPGEAVTIRIPITDGEALADELAGCLLIREDQPPHPPGSDDEP